MTAPAPAARRPRPLRTVPWLPTPTALSFAVAVLAILLSAYASLRALADRTASADGHARALEEALLIERITATLTWAEAGQRSYMLLGDDSYLEPFLGTRATLPGEFERLRALTRGIAGQEERVNGLIQAAEERLVLMDDTIELQRAGDESGARDLVRSGRGRELMTKVRGLAADAEADAQRRVLEGHRQWAAAARWSTGVAWGTSALLVALAGAGAFLLSRDHRARETAVWQRVGRAGFSARILGGTTLDGLGRTALSFLAEYLEARAGALYVVEPGGRLRRCATHALPADVGRELVAPGEGLLGEAARGERLLRVRDVPAGYLPVTSSLGSAQPVEIAIAPARVDGVTHAVVELAFFRPIAPAELELIESIGEALAVAVRATRDRDRVAALLAETQGQAEELKAQQEELEESNAQLEEQAAELEAQKETLTATEVALRERAAELERVNSYKTEFLANMSHELRTPLNSALILAQLLADNKSGNLDEEEVRFARTIHSAGTDLLVLINDILDLSRIEAGKVDVEIAPVELSGVVEALVRAYEPAARQKGLGFRATIAPDAPGTLETDARRLGQILRNLLSNAIKFTSRGEVTLTVESASAGVAFRVRDTGIGVAEDQLEAIFEAFRQADGSTHRKYGGTGLGLSISRDLARLLGGEVGVRSALGAGSEFTLTIPIAHVLPAAPSNGAPPRHAPSASPPLPAPEAALAPIEIGDDRDGVHPGARTILVIEDDVRFAAILRDLAREKGFLCVVTHTASDGLIAAKRFQPSAILLDVKLPDHGRLGVLDQLKSSPATRHIPVHVMSVVDHARESLELGALGFALKPIDREELEAVFARLERYLERTGRRVLVVEDDERQRDSIARLLSAKGVEIVGVESASAALAELCSATYDCLVLDLNLPDLSGFDLLAEMAERDDVAFPPTIVYTGRSLSQDEEQRLSRYARSIIVKDARSPERLLDEVTLFLHQVESTLPTERREMLRAARIPDGALERRRILIVEDDVRNLFALSRVLEPRGAKVEIARNGREAIDVLERSMASADTAIDLVLMDVMMPEMDGLQAMREIRKRSAWSSLPIIALTAKAMNDDRDHCLQAGANDYIAKPLDVDRLLSLVRVWLPR